MNPAIEITDAYTQAETMIAEGNLRQAADLCKEMLDANPDYPYGYHLMASLFRATGTFERALTFAQMATQMAPGVCAFHLQHGQLLYSLEEYEAAALSFMAAYNIEPTNPIIILLLASTFTSRGEFDEAQGLFQHARTLSDIPEIDEQEGLFHMQQGNTAMAEKFFDRLIARCPNYIWGHVYRGQLLMAGKQLAQAEASMARALRLAPENFEALFALAILNDWQGQSEIAIRYAMEAIKVKPLGWECHAFLGGVLVRERHYAEAHQVLTQALTIRPHNPYMLQQLFLALRMQSREPDFMAYIHGLLQQYPKNAILAYFEAMTGEIETPLAAPPAYIAGYYDSFAPQYDHYQQHVMSCHTPDIIARHLKKYPDEALPPHGCELLDVGCGTGLIAAALADRASYRVGVDLSPKMLERARNRQLYNELHMQEMVEFMLSCPQNFDLVVASDALCATGDVAPFLKAARNVLTPKGVLLFTIEKDFHAASWRLNPNGRYTHAPKYISSLLTHKGYQQLHQQEFTLYIDNTISATGVLFMAKKIQTH